MISLVHRHRFTKGNREIQRNSNFHNIAKLKPTVLQAQMDFLYNFEVLKRSTPVLYFRLCCDLSSNSPIAENGGGISLKPHLKILSHVVRTNETGRGPKKKTHAILLELSENWYAIHP